jgi:hypothetical protein
VPAMRTEQHSEGCAICLEPLSERMLHVYDCGHIFHGDCSRQVPDTA